MEADIAQQLKQNIPQAVPVTPIIPTISTDEPSSGVSDEISEISLLRLGNYFNVNYEQEGNKLKYIYEEAAALSGESSYEGVITQVNNLLLRLGLKYEPDRYMKLHLWLKLNQESLAIQRKMDTI